MNFLQIIMGKTSNFRYSIRHSKKLGFRLIKPFYSAARFCILILPGFPHSIFAFIKYRKYYHQYRNYTCENRYPALFAICRDYFKNRQNVKILSFGCSTGEEVYSINSYLPQATIIGTDINPYNLRQCKKKKAKKNIRFIHTLSEEYQYSKNFDAIFCMAVLQHIKNREEVNVATKFTFQQFEKQLIALDEKLKVGGLLFIDKTDFDFAQTAIYGRYSPLDLEGSRTVIDRPLFNSNNVKVSEKNDCYKVFLKKK
jgi:hypothetical protein